jgi:hypothetical protein
MGEIYKKNLAVFVFSHIKWQIKNFKGKTNLKFVWTERTKKPPGIVMEIPERAVSSDRLSTNTHFTVVEVLRAVLVAVYNLTAQD